MKKYFFIVNLVFLSGAAFLSARASNVFVGYFLAPNTDGNAHKQVANVKNDGKDKESRDFGSATERNIFAAKRETLVEVKGEEQEAGPELDLSGEPVPTSLRIKLIATSVFTVPEWSIATIEDVGAKTALMYSVNSCSKRRGLMAATQETEIEPEEGVIAAVEVRSEERPGPCNRLLDTATIIDIQNARVTFVNESSGRKEYIDFNAEVPAGGPVIAKASSKADKGPTGEGIRKTGANSYEVQQSEIDATLSNLNTIATQARIVPSFKDGKANGFKLFSIRPGSLYSKIGIQNGDVVQRINGYEMSSPDKALEIYTKLKDSKQVTVDLLRRGKPQTVDYSIVQ